MHTEHPSSPPSPAAYRGDGAFITFQVADAEAEYKRLADDGMSFDLILTDEPWGQRRLGSGRPGWNVVDVVEQIDPAEGWWDPYLETEAAHEPRLRSRSGLDPEVARPLAARCAELGYASMWSNDHPGAKGLETLAEFAAAAPEVDLGVAVIALDRNPPEEIAADIERARPRPGAALARGRRRLLGEAADPDARVAARASREAAGRTARPRRDGPEDVRARRR